MEKEEDDGSLSFLKIPEQDGNKQFHGKEISQSELVNTSFWVLDITLTNTKFGKDRMLVRGKHANAINLRNIIKNKVYEINTKQRQATNMVGCRKRKLLLPFQHQGN